MSILSFHGHLFEFDTNDWSQSLVDVRDNLMDLVSQHLASLSKASVVEACYEWSRVVDGDEDEPVWFNGRLDGAGGELQDALDRLWLQAFKDIDTSMLSGHNFILNKIHKADI